VRESSPPAGIPTLNSTFFWAGVSFPGEHHQASFNVHESDESVNITMKSADAAITVEIDGSIAEGLPSTSIFSTLAEASSFFI
jgi:hypothetical protein